MTDAAQTLELSLPALHTLQATIIADDEQDGFPSEAKALVNDHRIMAKIVPHHLGGELTCIKSLLDINRVLSRRNLTAAIAIGQSLLGALPVWIAGGPAQQKRMAEILQSGGFNCLALTEERYGSDLQSNQVTLAPNPNSAATPYLLNGTKWCINNATRGRSLSLLVRSQPDGGEQGFSMLFLDKAALDTTTISNIPRIKTHGIRGADISGISFDHTPIPANAILGRLGNGLKITLQTLQISRTLCAGFSLGAADTCLRLTTQFAHQRQLYSAPIAAIGSTQALLAYSYRQLMLCEAVAWTMARACTLLPEQMALYSSLVKYIVPVSVDALIARCSVVLGARGYLREGDFAIFQKMKRDHAVVSLFDGSTEVNLYVISGQLRSLFQARTNRKDYTLAWDELYDLNHPAPTFTGAGLKLSNRGNDFIWEGLAALSDSNDPALTARAQSLLSAYEQLKADYLTHSDTASQMSAATFATVKTYCELSVKALYLQFWHYNRAKFATGLGSIAWLDSLLADATQQSLDNHGLDLLNQQTESHQLYSHLTFQLTE